MQFGFSSEQDEFRQIVRLFCAAKSPSAEVRRLMATDSGFDPEVWAQMSSELGLQALIVPEKHGGSGYGYKELVIVLEEMGRVLFSGPFFATVALATNALLTAGDEAASADYLPGIAEGATIATLAVAEDSGSFDLERVALAASHRADGWVLDGHKNFVIDGATADLLLVAARSESGLSLFAVDSAAGGLTKTNLPTLDQTRKMARIEFAATPARLIGEQGGALAGLSAALDRAAVALAAEQVGVADNCLQMSVQYAKDRIQFDRPIGSFQAIKHMCADMLVDLESARSAAYYGAWAVAEDSDELPVIASLVKAHCSNSCFRVAGKAIQVHGGIGYTWEHDAHLYFKRAKFAELMLGDPEYHGDLMAARAGF